MADDDGPLSIDISSHQRMPSGGGILSRRKRQAMGKLAGKSSGGSDSSSASSEITALGQGAEVLGAMKRGGKVRKTGIYKLHRGERVLTTKQASRYRSRRASKR